MPPYKVLVPLDGSKLSENSLAYLDPLRSLGESQVLLLSVVDESEDFQALTPAEARDRELNLLSTYLREVAADVTQHLGIDVDTKVAHGVPADCILEEARRFSPDLLVISTHGRSGMSRWRLGSVADKVIRAAEANTLVVGPKASERTTWLEARIMAAFGSLLVPLDGSALAERALPVAVPFAEAFGSTIHLVRVVPIPIVTDGFAGEAVYTPDLLDSLLSAARTYVSSTATRLSRLGATKTDVIVGPAASQLEDYVLEKKIDLVIMTSHGRSGLGRMVLGSVTDRLLGGPVPVLVVRPVAD